MYSYISSLLCDPQCPYVQFFFFISYITSFFLTNFLRSFIQAIILSHSQVAQEQGIKIHIERIQIYPCSIIKNKKTEGRLIDKVNINKHINICDVLWAI